MPVLDGKRKFPCPICADAREVRLTKKKKPYIVCEPCGTQVFVRGPSGIAAFNRLADGASDEDVWTRLKEMRERYYLKCPKCGHRFWIGPELAQTSVWDGSLKGFQCPNEDCDAIVAWERKQ